MSADIEGGWKAWLRARAGFTTVFGNRAFLRADAKAAYPQLVITRIGGGDDTSEANIETALVQFDVWGELNDRHGCHQAKSAVRTELRSICGGTTLLNAGCAVLGLPRVLDDRFLPDPSTNRPRYVLTVECVTIDPTITD